MVWWNSVYCWHIVPYVILGWNNILIKIRKHNFNAFTAVPFIPTEHIWMFMITDEQFNSSSNVLKMSKTSILLIYGFVSSYDIKMNICPWHMTFIILLQTHIWKSLVVILLCIKVLEDTRGNRAVYNDMEVIRGVIMLYIQLWSLLGILSYLWSWLRVILLNT